MGKWFFNCLDWQKDNTIENTPDTKTCKTSEQLIEIFTDKGDVVCRSMLVVHLYARTTNR